MTVAPSPSLSLAVQAIAAGRLQEAEEHTRRILEQGHTADAQNLLGNIALRRGDWTSARDAFQLTVDLAPDNHKALINLAMAEEQLGRTQVALQRFAELVARFPDFEPGRRKAAKVLLGAERPREALGVLAPIKQNDLETHALRGGCLLAIGNPRGAAAEFQAALSIAPNDLDSLAGLCTAKLALQLYDDATQLAARIRGLDPYRAALLQAEIHDRQNAPEEALAALRVAVRSDKLASQALACIAQILSRTGDLEGAKAAVVQLLEKAPDAPETIEAFIRLLRDKKEKNELKQFAESYAARPTASARVLNYIAVLAKELELDDFAIDYARRATERHPNEGVLEYNLGCWLVDTAEEESERRIRRALELIPTHPGAWLMLSAILLRQMKYEAAERAARRAGEFRPNETQWMINLALILRARSDDMGAIFYLRRALEVDPKCSAAEYNLSFVLMSVGEIEQGFRAYDARWAVGSKFPSPRRPFPQSVWRGQPLNQQSILVWGEQGVGDELLFAWFLQHLEHDAAKIYLEVDPRLCEMFRRSFRLEEVFGRVRQPPEFATTAGTIDFKAPMGHLGKFYWPQLKKSIQENWVRAASNDILRTEGYLRADPQRIQNWRAKLPTAEKKPLIGISWRSGLMTKSREVQYMTPVELCRILHLDAYYVNLQYSHTEEELDVLRRALGERLIEPEGVDLRNDLEDVAAIIANLDLVVSAGTAVSGMSGALGIPTWTFQTSESGKTWDQFGTPFLPFQPSLRIHFRHPRDNWDSVIDTMRRKLEAFQLGFRREAVA